MERAQLLHYAIRYHGDYNAISRALQCHEGYDPHFQIEQAITLLDDPYPERLRELNEPP